MADNPSKVDQIRKLREARALAAERIDAGKTVDLQAGKKRAAPSKPSPADQ